MSDGYTNVGLGTIGSEGTESTRAEFWGTFRRGIKDSPCQPWLRYQWVATARTSFAGRKIPGMSKSGSASKKKKKNTGA